jgi:hypothetical protein
MNLKLSTIALCLSIGLFSCKKDLGNYEYNPPSEPVIGEIRDSTYAALIGDSLIIRPEINLEGADPLKDLHFRWEITIQEELRAVTFEGYPLRMLYNLGPGLRAAKLIITDLRNGLKYPVPFKIQGTTQFSQGTLVLSDYNGAGSLSFIKPDNKTILADLYADLHGEPLPANPVQIYYAQPLPYQPATTEVYWILGNDPGRPSVVLDAATLLRRDYFPSQFFTPPPEIRIGRIEAMMGTVANGVINDKLYIGITSTAPFAPDYGKFANEQSGDYELSPFFTHGSNFYFGFDKKAKAFVVFGGSGSYEGTNYVVETGSEGFDPKNVGLSNLIYMNTGESGTGYAFFQTAENIQELAFNYKLNEPNKTFRAEGKRTFKGSSLVNADTRWVRNALNVFYFSSNDKVYRYNPVNEDLRALDANFNGKKVSMIKISDDNNSLTVGTEGALYTLNISTGNNGKITQTIEGIPGSPVDIIIKK